MYWTGTSAVLSGVAQTYAFLAFVCGSSCVHGDSCVDVNSTVDVSMLRTADEGKRRLRPRYPLALPPFSTADKLEGAGQAQPLRDVQNVCSKNKKLRNCYAEVRVVCAPLRYFRGIAPVDVNNMVAVPM